MITFDYSKLVDFNLSGPQKISVEMVFRKCRSTLTGPWKMSQQEVVTQFFTNLRRCLLYNAMPSVVAAQGIIEGAWFGDEGKGILFGIKARKQDILNGSIISTKTQEVTDRGRVSETDSFFVGSMANQFQNYFAYLARMKPLTERYTRSITDDPGGADRQGYMDYLEEEPAYSTETAKFGDMYYETVSQVIHNNQLWAWDVKQT